MLHLSRPSAAVLHAGVFVYPDRLLLWLQIDRKRMATRIDILAIGYAKPVKINNKNNMAACGSCCLVRVGQTKVLFDTMGPWERQTLVDKLAEFKIHPDDIDHIVCSHSHPDHIGNLNLFTKRNPTHFVGTSVYSQDLYDLNCFEPIGSYKYRSPKVPDDFEVITYQNHQLDSNISIEPSQGHTMECVSLIVSQCETYGTVGLVGDLFEREEDVLDESIWLAAGSQNPDLQRANRSRIYNKVDFVLPGHGPLFKTAGNIV